MLDAARHDQELARSSHTCAIAKVHPEPSLDDEEQLVLALVVMPDELALELHQLDVLAVQLADDARIPVVGELGQLRGDRDLLHEANRSAVRAGFSQEARRHRRHDLLVSCRTGSVSNPGRTNSRARGRMASRALPRCVPAVR